MANVKVQSLFRNGIDVNDFHLLLEDLYPKKNVLNFANMDKKKKKT